MLNLFQLKSLSEIRDVLDQFDRTFVPCLSERVHDIDAYAKKLVEHAFVYAATGNDILGFIAFYANDTQSCIAYITQIAVKTSAQNKGIGRKLLNKCIDVSKSMGMTVIKLEVFKNNILAISFYEKNGFLLSSIASECSFYMEKPI